MDREWLFTSSYVMSFYKESGQDEGYGTSETAEHALVEGVSPAGQGTLLAHPWDGDTQNGTSEVSTAREATAPVAKIQPQVC